jgi:hypothetical protein
MGYNQIIAISIFLLQIQGSVFALEAIRSDATLPTPRFATAAAYDGDDSIYIVGGYQGGYTTTIGEILRYSISTEDVQVVARFPDNQVRRSGSAVYDPNADILYYFGGADFNGNGARNYWTIDVTQGTMTSAQLGVWAWNGNSAVWDNATQSALLFGSQNPWDGSQVIAFSTTSREFTNQLPWSPPDVLKFDLASTVWDSVNRVAYIMGGSSLIEGDLKYDRIFKWTASNRQLELLDITLPYDIMWTSGVWDASSNCAYLIGTGYFPWDGENNALRFCPSTNNITAMVVDNFPPRSEETSSVYVEKLNRIYIFGGWIENSIQSNEIVYIDL